MNLLKKHRLADLDTHVAPFNISSLEARLEADLATVMDMQREPTPSAEDLGRITAEAVKQSHEEAAQAITELGIQAAARVERINALKLEADALSKACLDLAEQFRARGHAQSDAIEATAKLNNEARAMVDEMRKKIEQPVSADKA